jgi:hypothetical protein
LEAASSDASDCGRPTASGINANGKRTEFFSGKRGKAMSAMSSIPRFVGVRFSVVYGCREALSS